MLRVGDRVEVVAHWSAFRGQTGVVTEVEPHTMVLLDEYEKSIRIDASSLAAEPAE
jgi:hypothetical protein